jgi:hypothetical protein
VDLQTKRTIPSYYQRVPHTAPEPAAPSMWTRSEVIGIAKASCTFCHGYGMLPVLHGVQVPCNCVFRAIFRICHARYRECEVMAAHTKALSREESVSGIGRVSPGWKTSALHIDFLIQRLLTAFDMSIVTTNWDIMAERCLERQGTPFFYSRQSDLRRPAELVTGIPVWKLHGSGNWGYCDVCRNLITSEITLGKTTVRFGWLLEAEDFRLFRGGRKIAQNLGTAFRECVGCQGRTAVRVATFSYRKHLDVPFFQSIWDDARESLRSAERWLFIGYSMPEADVEIRHLLKTAELSHRRGTRPRIDVVLKDDHSAGLRYRRLFGRAIRGISNAGIERWVAESLDNYCDQ